MIDFSSSGNSSVGSSNAAVAAAVGNLANANNLSNSLMNNFRALNSQLHGNFGVVGGVSGPPPPLDLNEFPSLGGSSINVSNRKIELY